MAHTVNPTPIFSYKERDAKRIIGWGGGMYKSYGQVIDSPHTDIQHFYNRLTRRWSDWSYWGYGEFVFGMDGRGWYVNNDLMIWELGLGGKPIEFDVWDVDGWYPLPFTSEDWRVTTKSTVFNKSRGWARRRIKGYRLEVMPEWHAHLVLEANWGT